MGNNCLLTPLVIGYSRVPEPPARTIPFIKYRLFCFWKVEQVCQLLRSALPLGSSKNLMSFDILWETWQIPAPFVTQKSRKLLKMTFIPLSTSDCVIFAFHGPRCACVRFITSSLTEAFSKGSSNGLYVVLLRHSLSFLRSLNIKAIPMSWQDNSLIIHLISFGLCHKPP